MELINRNLSGLKDTLFDILIIGGGISGAGIARDAALRGFKVCLLEKKDFASGTSGKSSKLIHGGLRYLEHGHFSLVGEALRERSYLLKIAPHLVRPLPFLLPIYRSSERHPFRIKVGLSLYDRLAGPQNIHPHEKLSFHDLLQEVPGLKVPGLQMAFRYYDAQMNDARLTLENILSATRLGARCLNYVKVTQLLEQDSKISGVIAHDLASNEKIEIHSKLVINATGPWLDQLLGNHESKTSRRLRLTKGIHLVLPRLHEKNALLLFTQKDGRVFFCLPWGPNSLVGTTETDYHGTPDDVRATREDVQYLISEIQRFFPTRSLTPQDVIATFAGLRPLIQQDGRTMNATSRKYSIEETRPQLFSILGGKFTTYRSLAEEVVTKAAKALHMLEDKPCQTANLALPGAESLLGPEAFAEENSIGIETAHHLIQHYGARAIEVARYLKELGLKARLCPSHPHIQAEVLFAFTHEMAVTLEDFMTRRTFIRYSHCRGLDCLDPIANILLELSLFTEEELEGQKTRYKESVTGFFKYKKPSNFSMPIF